MTSKAADLLDAGVIFGTGFAPFRGGPLQYARNRGIDEILQTLGQLAEQYGDRFEPHEGWSKLRSRAESCPQQGHVFGKLCAASRCTTHSLPNIDKLQVESTLIAIRGS